MLQLLAQTNDEAPVRVQRRFGTAVDDDVIGDLRGASVQNDKRWRRRGKSGMDPHRSVSLGGTIRSRIYAGNMAYKALASRSMDRWSWIGVTNTS
jgi:hypothetical protein